MHNNIKNTCPRGEITVAFLWHATMLSVWLWFFSPTFGNLKSAIDYSYYLGFFSLPFPWGTESCVAECQDTPPDADVTEKCCAGYPFHVFLPKLGGNREDWATDGKMCCAKFQPLWNCSIWTWTGCDLEPMLACSLLTQWNLWSWEKKADLGF